MATDGILWGVGTDANERRRLALDARLRQLGIPVPRRRARSVAAPADITSRRSRPAAEPPWHDWRLREAAEAAAARGALVRFYPLEVQKNDDS
jgi:hypothetical protein